jgi:hypothetical protein
MTSDRHISPGRCSARFSLSVGPRLRSIPRPRSGRIRDRGAVDSATAELESATAELESATAPAVDSATAERSMK